jgi:hypothetical protein
MYQAPQSFQEIKGLLEGSPPIALPPIIQRLGLEVYFAPLNDGVSGKLLSNKLLPKGLAGGSSGWTILINASEHPRRSRFTIAHEIGHFLLHKDIASQYGRIVDDAHYRSEQISDFRESEANRFAADLLMPWPQIKAHIDRPDITSVEQMADLFQVSKIAMAIRLGVEA